MMENLRLFGVYIHGEIIMDIDPEKYVNGECYVFSVNRTNPDSHPVRFYKPTEYEKRVDFTKVYTLVERYIHERYHGA